MKYLCLIYVDEAMAAAMPPAAMEAYVKEYFALSTELRENGQLIAGEALQPAKTGTLLQVRSGKTSIIDGPFIESKEQLGGFYFIEARDLNEALRIGAKIPMARHGTIEVRPIQEFS